MAFYPFTSLFAPQAPNWGAYGGFGLYPQSTQQPPQIGAPGAQGGQAPQAPQTSQPPAQQPQYPSFAGFGLNQLMGSSFNPWALMSGGGMGGFNPYAAWGSGGYNPYQQFQPGFGGMGGPNPYGVWGGGGYNPYSFGGYQQLIGNRGPNEASIQIQPKASRIGTPSQGQPQYDLSAGEAAIHRRSPMSDLAYDFTRTPMYTGGSPTLPRVGGWENRPSPYGPYNTSTRTMGAY